MAQIWSICECRQTIATNGNTPHFNIVHLSSSAKLLYLLYRIAKSKWFLLCLVDQQQGWRARCIEQHTESHRSHRQVRLGARRGCSKAQSSPIELHVEICRDMMRYVEYVDVEYFNNYIITILHQLSGRTKRSLCFEEKKWPKRDTKFCLIDLRRRRCRSLFLAENSHETNHEIMLSNTI